MHRIQKSAVMPYTAEQMFSLVNDIERYPDFLPWCRRATVLHKAENQIKGELVLAKGGIEKTFTTLNTSIPAQEIMIQLVSGPFKQLKGVWKFHPLGPQESQVELDLQFEFSNRLIALVFGPVFQQAANSLVDAFVAQAADTYGR